MGFMDNVKSKANLAATKAQESLAQGQDKFNELQARRAADKLLTDLGRAVWAHQRTGGSPDMVNEVLGQLDAWVAEHGPIQPPREEGADGVPSAAGDPAPPPSGAPVAPPAPSSEDVVPPPPPPLS